VAKIAVFLDAEAARLPPRQRLVVPEAARVEADVSANSSHVPEKGGSHSLRSFDQNRVVLCQEIRVLDFVQCSQRADLSSLLRLADSSQLTHLTDVEDVLWLEEFLPHGREQVGSSGEDAGVFVRA